MELMLIIGVVFIIAYSIGKSKAESNIRSELSLEQTNKEKREREKINSTLKHELRNIETEYIRFYLQKNKSKYMNNLIDGIYNINEHNIMTNETFQNLLKNKDSSLIIEIENTKNEDFLNGKYIIKREIIFDKTNNVIFYINYVEI